LALIPLLGVLVFAGLDVACNPVKEAHADCGGESDTCRPELAGDSLDGTRVEEATLAGKVVVVNFWATWCGPCRQEIPALEKVWKTHAGGGLAMVGVLTADAASDSSVQSFMVESGMTYPVLRDDGDLRRKFKLRHGLPVTLVYDRQGALVLRHEGAISARKLETAIAPLLR
jgi:thiol-disulfide isomerase/thioredoxin